MATVSSEIIPRERLSAWQRWELAALASTVVPEPMHAAAGANGTDAGMDPGLAALHEEARAVGYA